MDGGTYHEVIAKHPETGEKMGHLSWDHEFIQSVFTVPTYRRQGVGTAMWNQAHKVSAEQGIPAPRHSPTRTEDGRAWADKVGGEFPFG